MEDNKYKGLEENIQRFENDLLDEKTNLLFKIAYKQGYDKALSLFDVSKCEYCKESNKNNCDLAIVSHQRELLLAFADYSDYRSDRNQYISRYMIDDFLKANNNG